MGSTIKITIGERKQKGKKKESKRKERHKKKLAKPERKEKLPQ